MALNRDLSPPLGQPANVPVNFDADKPETYWLKRRILNEDLTYTFTDEMPAQAMMHIPKVVRFLHTFGDDKDIAAAYCSSGTGDTPCQNKTWVFTSQEIDDSEGRRWPVDEIYPTLTSGGYVLSEISSTTIGATAHKYGGTYGIRSDGLPIGSMPIPDELVNGIIVTYYYFSKTTGTYICWDDIPFSELILF